MKFSRPLKFICLFSNAYLANAQVLNLSLPTLQKARQHAVFGKEDDEQQIPVKVQTEEDGSIWVLQAPGQLVQLRLDKDRFKEETSRDLIALLNQDARKGPIKSDHCRDLRVEDFAVDVDLIALVYQVPQCDEGDPACLTDAAPSRNQPSPEEALAAAGAKRLAYESRQMCAHKVALIDRHSFKRLFIPQVPKPANISSVQFAPNGDLLAIAALQGQMFSLERPNYKVNTPTHWNHFYSVPKPVAKLEPPSQTHDEADQKHTAQETEKAIHEKKLAKLAHKTPTREYRVRYPWQAIFISKFQFIMSEPMDSLVSLFRMNPEPESFDPKKGAKDEKNTPDVEISQPQVLVHFGVRPGQVIFPKGLAWDPQGKILFIADSLSGTIQSFDLSSAWKKDENELKIDLQSQADLALLSVEEGQVLHIKHPYSLAWLAKDRVLIVADPLQRKVIALDIIDDQSKPEANLAAQINLLKDNDLYKPSIHAPCVQCHDASTINSLDIFRNDKTQHAFEINPALAKKISSKIPISRGKVQCTSCHKHHAMDARQSFLRTEEGYGVESLCINCHREKLLKSPKTHPTVGEVKNVNILSQMIQAGISTDGQMTCKTCHNLHRPEGAGDFLLARSYDKLCDQCHRQKWDKQQNHPLSVTGAKLNDEKSQPMCFNCHDLHDRSAVSEAQKPDSKSKLRSAEVKTLCTDCHSNKKPLLQSAHQLQNLSKKMDLDAKGIKTSVISRQPDCTSCHQVHNSKKDQSLLRMSVASDPQDERASGFCINCHPKTKDGRVRSNKHTGMLSFDKNREGITAMYLVNHQNQPFNPKKDRRGFLSCMSCHDPHLDNKVNANFLRDYNPIVTYCNTCHKNDGLMRYKYFHEERFKK